MIKGIDVSHWQGTINWGKVKKAKVEFAVIKCSESTSFVDPMFATNKSQARKAAILCGFYHFARQGKANDEADFFVKSVGELNSGEFLVLDAETGQTDQWNRDFCDRVFSKTGIRPIVYPRAGKLCLEGNYGLWVARYGLNNGSIPTVFKPNLGIYPFYVMWQYTSRGKIDGIVGNVDLNVAYIPLETLKKYGKQLECLGCPIHCPK